MKLLSDYLLGKEKLFEYFGYVEDWVAIPIDDARDYYWVLFQEENGSGSVLFHETEKELSAEHLEDMQYYRNTIYTQRFLPKWVYEGEDYTMICVDTHTDGNKFLQIFDNKKRLPIPEGVDVPPSIFG